MGPREQENRLSLFSFLNMKIRGIPDNNMPNINAIYIFTLSLRALTGRGNPPLRAQRGNLIQEIVIARSRATWQSQPFFMRLLRPYGARNDKRRNLLRSSRWA